MAHCEASYPSSFFQFKTVSVKYTICLCLQYTVPRHSLYVTVENVSQTATAVLVLICAQMAVMKMDVVSSLFAHNAQCCGDGIPNTI